MKIYISFAIFLLLVQSVVAQTTVMDRKTQQRFETDITASLPSGNFTVDIMDQVGMSPQRRELQEKFSKALQTHYDWFMEQRKIMEQTGEEIPYHPNMGMTETEWTTYKKMLDEMSDMQAISSGIATVTVRKVGHHITFEASGKLASLNETSIDIKKMTVTVGVYTLPFTGTVEVENDKNIFKTAWKGYRFEYSDGGQHLEIPETREALTNFSLSLFRFTIGKFESTGQTFIEIMGKVIADGEQTVRYQIPFLFQK